jgi:hypothetical protein
MIAAELGYAGVGLLPLGADRPEHHQLSHSVLGDHRRDANHRVSPLHRTRPALREAADRLSLTVEKRTAIGGETIAGRVHGVRIVIGPAPGGFAWKKSSPGGLEIKLLLDAPLGHRFVIASKGERLHRLPPGEPVKLHDPVFDEELVVYGRASEAAGRLDANLRRRLVELSRRAAIHAEEGTITFVTRTPIKVGVVLSRLVEKAAELARDLSADGPSMPSRLLANAMSEETVEVRFFNLDLLLREYPTSDQAQDGLRIAWDARERSLRYLAAIRRGREGLEFLCETAELTSESPSLRVMIMRHLAHLSEPKTLADMLRRQLRDESATVARTAIELLGRLRDPHAVQPLAAIATHRWTHEETRIRAIDALASIGDPSVERFLVDFLHGDHELARITIKTAAAAALGKLGTRAALKPLTRFKQQYRAITAIAEVANTAIARIESRYGPAERGQLSLAMMTEADGALSLPHAPKGAISHLNEARRAAFEASSFESRSP